MSWKNGTKSNPVYRFASQPFAQQTVFFSVLISFSFAVVVLEVNGRLYERNGCELKNLRCDNRRKDFVRRWSSFVVFKEYKRTFVWIACGRRYRRLKNSSIQHFSSSFLSKSKLKVVLQRVSLVWRRRINFVYRIGVRAKWASVIHIRVVIKS